MEAGQLLVVAGAGALCLAARRLPAAALAPARTAALYAIGTMAAWWTFERVASILA